MLKKEVELGIKLINQSLEFKKKKNHFYKPLNDNAIATLGFGIATHNLDGKILLNITVGVLNKDIEQIAFGLTGYNRAEDMQPTVSIQIGYLMPENGFREWHFIEGLNHSAVFSDIQKSVEIYAFPYFKMMADINNIEDYYLKQSRGKRDQYLPIIYYLKGKKEKGLQIINEVINRDSQPISEERKNQLLKSVGSEGNIVIGSGYNGKVDPLYLKFSENYRKL
jgi:hypothetical protein